MDRSLPVDYQISLPEIDVEHIFPITNGGVSNIYRGLRFRKGVFEKVALKVIFAARLAPIQTIAEGERKSDPGITRNIHLHWKEIKLWAELRHANIHPVYGLYWELADVPAIVSPWSDYGDVMQYLKLMRESEKVDDIMIASIKLDVIEDIAHGVTYLHTHSPPIIHGDLKGANILISNERVARISDFGYSSALKSNLPVNPRQEQAVPKEETREPSLTHSPGPRGTTRWMAPELFMYDDSAPNTVQTDIWSFGCVMLEIWSDMHPFHDIRTERRVMVALSEQEIPAFAGPANAPFERALQKCLAIDPAARKTVHQVQLDLYYVPPRDTLCSGRPSGKYSPGDAESNNTSPIPAGVKLRMEMFNSPAGGNSSPGYIVVVNGSKAVWDEQSGERFHLRFLKKELDNYTSLRHSHILPVIASTSFGVSSVVVAIPCTRGPRAFVRSPFARNSLWYGLPQTDQILQLAQVADALDFIHRTTHCVYGEDLERSIVLDSRTRPQGPQLVLDHLQSRKKYADSDVYSTWGTESWLDTPLTVAQDMFYFGILIVRV
ncbi:kinase-like protein [Exidia glandulosa HHB12029]|uniref:Kinase-like protein n=1 Tax=Exidia glandulosa HHB12029 TaxID=1314781 RepID=A0A166BBI5_EXIGL|nr:kinase-like protein [Exidia glandulosa HHB12029]